MANAARHRVEYWEGNASDWTVDDESITTATHTVDGLACGTEYQFRVSAYGDGTTYAAVWSEPSGALTVSTATCVPPVLDSTSYSFSVVIDAALGAEVGRVSATDDSGNPSTFAITAGNEAGLFVLDPSSGAINVASDLSSQAGTTVTLTVEATDEGGHKPVLRPLRRSGHRLD